MLSEGNRSVTDSNKDRVRQVLDELVGKDVFFYLKSEGKCLYRYKKQVLLGAGIRKNPVADSAYLLLFS